MFMRVVGTDIRIVGSKTKRFGYIITKSVKDDTLNNFACNDTLAIADLIMTPALHEVVFVEPVRELTRYGFDQVHGEEARALRGAASGQAGGRDEGGELAHVADRRDAQERVDVRSQLCAGVRAHLSQLLLDPAYVAARG